MTFVGKGPGGDRGLASAIVLCMVLGGCTPKPELQPAVQRSMSGIIEQVNANNILIRNLWARLDIMVQTPDEKHSVGGYLILRKPNDFSAEPRELLLQGKDSLGAAEFQLGSNNQEYWYMLDAPGDKRVYSHQFYGEGSDSQASQALDLLSALGVYELPRDAGAEPWPVLRGYEEPAYYVVSFIEQAAGAGMRVRKDIWWNRRTQKVDLIELFDELGHRYVSTALDDYRQFDGAYVATKLHIVWHEEKLTLTLKLKDVKINSDKVRDKSFEHRKPKWAQDYAAEGN